MIDEYQKSGAAFLVWFFFFLASFWGVSLFGVWVEFSGCACVTITISYF